MRIVVALLLAASVYGAWHAWQDREFRAPEGVLARADPLQRDLDPPLHFDARGFAFSERARYDLTVRVLRKERYRLDGVASIAPYDLAVGWGPMSDSQVLKQLEITQMGRFFYWRMRDSATFPLAVHDLVASAGQIHAIPADEHVEAALAHIRRGQVITLHGYLVDVRGPRGFAWNTSLTREDTGDGACEIMWIESIDAA
ncbi:MAG: hypothetical protein ABI881_08345 [Betaproteobacteria bacterium]